MSPQSNPQNDDLEKMVSVSVSRDASDIQREGSALFKVPSFIVDKKNLLVIHSIPDLIP
jgi:hypothetical protein